MIIAKHKCHLHDLYIPRYSTRPEQALTSMQIPDNKGRIHVTSPPLGDALSIASISTNT